MPEPDLSDTSTSEPAVTAPDAEQRNQFTGELATAIAAVLEVESGDEAVIGSQHRMLAFAAQHADALHRTCIAGHFTASTLILDHAGESVLLLHHAKIHRWLQPGGHVDGQGDLAVAALREAWEETGVVGLEILGPAIDLDTHMIPAHGDEPEHDHLDVRFLLVAPKGAKLDPNHESTDLRWFRFDEIEPLGVDPGLTRLVAAGRAAWQNRLDPTE